MSAFASYGNGLNYLSGTGFWGFVTLVLFNRSAAGKWFDTTHLTAKPARAFLWFMCGVSMATFSNIVRFRETGYDARTYNLHSRVAENEHTHAVLRNLRFHLQTRKMSVWDANPQ